jgi:hypothetical protein
MPCYLGERTFPYALEIPVKKEGERTCQAVIATNGDGLVTCGPFYVTNGTDERAKTFRINDALSHAAIHPAARRNSQPVAKVAMWWCSTK